VAIGAWRYGILSALATCGAAVVAAQSPLAQPEIPAAYEPPPGMCRVWLRDVPPMQQPAPTDCRSALRTKPVGATVVYGPEARRSSYSPNDWTRPSLRPARDDDRTRPPGRSGDDGGTSSGDACTDGGHDAKCDDAMTLPPMRAAVLWTEGQRPAELQRWFGTLNVAARFAMPRGGGSPDRVQWFDVDGRLVQIWTDRNGDGRADRVEIFNRDGARIRVVGQ
jgi:hypothetical protein